MIALHHVVEPDDGAVVARDGEAHGIGPVGRGKAGAAAARVAEVAEGQERGLVRSHGASGMARQTPSQASPSGSMACCGARSCGSRLHAGRNRGRPFRRYSSTSMASTRLETLKSMVEQNPRRQLSSRYGLAMEYRNAGDLEAAMREFRALIAARSGLLGRLLPRRPDAGAPGPAGRGARVVPRGHRGHHAQGRSHTRDEIQAALDLLG